MQKTNTFLMFVGDKCGRAEEAIRFYISIFPNSEIKSLEYFEPEHAGGRSNLVKLSVFTIDGIEYMANDSNGPHEFTFNPAISIFVNCSSENEIDELSGRLSEGGSFLMPPGNYGFSKKFSWLADKFGVSWQLNLKG